ncbi:MAG: ATP-binding protein [Fibrobacteria bacterium]|nr:ATP-binding protein [Fibrobacteria bacterium]
MFRDFNRLNVPMSFPLELSVLNKGEVDKQSTRTRKKAARIFSGFRLKLQRFGNFITRAKNPVIGLKRHFVPAGLSKHFVIIPTEQYLLSEWSLFQQSSATVLKTCSHVFASEFSSGIDSSVTTAFSEDLSKALEQHNNEKTDIRLRIHKHFTKVTESCFETWPLAGTCVLPRRLLSEKSFGHKNKKLKQQFIHCRKSWDKYWTGERLNLLKNIDLVCLSLKAGKCYQDTESACREWHDKHITATVSSLRDLVQQFRERARKSGKSPEKLRKFILEKETVQFIKNIQADSLGPVDALKTFTLSKLVTEYQETIAGIIDSLKDTYTAFRLTEKDGIVPQTELVDISLKALITFYSRKELDKAIKLISDSARNDILLLSNELMTVSDIIQGGLDTAFMLLRRANEKNEDLQQPSEVLLEGIDRTLDKLGYILSQVEALQFSTFTHLEEKHHSLIERVNSLQNTKKLMQMRLTFMKAKAQGSLKDFGDKAKHSAVSTFHFVRITVTPFLKQALRHLIRIVGVITVKARLKIDTTGVVESVNVYLRKAKSAISGLPAVYQRMFDFSPLEEERYFVGRESELTELQSAFENWRRDQSGMVALVGERGSGRSTLVNMARTRFLQGERIKYIRSEKTLNDFDEMRKFLEAAFDLSGTRDMRELEERVQKLPNDRVIILEDFHRLFIKTTEGLRIFNRMVLFAARTQQNTFWLISSGNYCWRYLDQVLELRRFFAQVIMLKELKGDEIEKVIMLRHRISGIPLQFSELSEVTKSRKYKLLHNENQRKELNRKKFFEHLHTNSGGNVSVAMVLWLIAIDNRDNKAFQLSHGISTDPRMLRNLTTDELFVITAIIQHEVLTMNELSSIMNISEDGAQLLLTGLYNRHILEEHNGIYNLHFFLYRPMTRMLYEKRFLH